MLKRGMASLFVICLLTTAASYGSIVMKAQVLRAGKAFIINDTGIAGKWDFQYSIKDGRITSGSFEEGPIISYVTKIIKGALVTSSPNPVLESSFKKESYFNAHYICAEKGHAEEVIFNKCRVLSKHRAKDGLGNPCIIYAFEAEEALKK